MAKITADIDCGNSPKMQQLKDFEIAFAEGNRALILENVAETLRWEMVGDRLIVGKEAADVALNTMLDGSIAELVIEHIMTHGDVGAVNGTITFQDGSLFGFCDVFQFASHGKAAKISGLTSYVVPKQK